MKHRVYVRSCSTLCHTTCVQKFETLSGFAHLNTLSGVLRKENPLQGVICRQYIVEYIEYMTLMIKIYDHPYCF